MIGVRYTPVDKYICLREAVVALSNKKCGNDENDIALSNAIETLYKLKAIQIDRRIGYWTRRRTIHHDGELYCSVCGKSALYSVYKQESYSEYCPHCGAEMCEVEPDE